MIPKRISAMSGMIWGVLWLTTILAGCDEPAPPPPRNFTVVSLPPSKVKLNVLLQEEYQKAKQLGRKPFVEMGAVWCVPCQKLHASMDDPRLIKAFSGTYIIQMDVDVWSRELLAAGFNPEGIPAFYEVNPEGYSTGCGIVGGDWNSNDPASDAGTLAAYFAGN